MKYITILFVLLSISSVLSSSVICEIDYTSEWPSQGCTSHSPYTAICSSMSMCLDFTANTTRYLGDVGATYIILMTNTYQPITDCVIGTTGLFPLSTNVIFETTMDYVYIQCPPNQLFVNLVLDYPVNLSFQNFKFLFTENNKQQDGPISIAFSPKEFINVLPTASFSNFIVTNSKGSSGGFISAYNYNVIISISQFTNCSASIGGAIYSTGNGTKVSVYKSTITGCSAYNYAGAIFGYNILIRNSTVSKNTCDYHNGGAIYGITSVNVVDSTMESNVIPSGYGGAISSIGSVSITNSIINKNSATYGGAISGNDVMIDSSSLTNNIAQNGGAIYSTNTLRVTKSQFIGNTASAVGGAIYLIGAGSIENSSLYKNSAVKNGGAVYINSPLVMNTFNYVTSEFTNNHAVQGGAIFADGFCAFDLGGSVFLDNSASVSAGSIFISNTDISNKIYGGTFVNSTSLGLAQTFNLQILQIISSVYVSRSLVNPGTPIYYVPIVFDSNTAPYARAYETNSNDCVNGIATIDENGGVTMCSCFTGYSGSNCNISN